MTLHRIILSRTFAREIKPPRDDGDGNCMITEQAKDVLRRHVLEPLLSRCVDEEYGGFLVDFDEQWRTSRQEP